MTYGRFKSKKRSRKYVKTSTGNKISYSKQPRKERRCISCSVLLQGNPGRMFSGVLCSRCVQTTIKSRAKSL